MDAEKSSNSSFEDLSHEGCEQAAKEEAAGGNAAKENITDDSKATAAEQVTEAAANEDDAVCDILGNGQLMKRTIKANKDAPRAKRLHRSIISFTGKLADGTIVEAEENFEIHVGDFEVVQGLDMALPLMNIGEVSEIVVSPRFAYNAIGLKNEQNPEKSIPADATITYVVTLIDTQYEELEDLKSFEVRKKFGTRKKERANFWYNRGEFNTAIQLYRRALDYLDNRDGDPESQLGDEDLHLSNNDLQALLEDRLIVYNNLAMSQIKVGAYDAALKSVDMVLRCQPNNAKALFRKGRILEKKGDTKGAIALMKKAANLEADSKSIQQDLAKLLIKARREENNEKQMYQKMLGQAKQMEQKTTTPQKNVNADNSKLKLLGLLMGSILVGVAGVAFYRYKY